MMKSLFFLFLFISNFNASANVSVNELRDNLSKKSNEVFKLGAKIRSLDKKLGRNNDSYLSNISKIKKIEDTISGLRNSIRNYESNVKTEFQNINKTLQYYLINQQESNDEDYLYRKEILKELITKQSNKYKKTKNESKKLLNLLSSYENQLEEYKTNSENIYQLIVDLENEKKDLSKSYLNKLDQKNEIEEKLEITLSRNKVYKKTNTAKVSWDEISLRPQLPLKDYLSYKGSKKGVTFKYNKVSPLVATESGKIVYSGELSSYGKVIMIDHGYNLRTVLLGDINIKVKKDDVVSKGEILGHLNSESGITKTLYYEIRQKNIAQNTLNLLKKIKTI